VTSDQIIIIQLIIFTNFTPELYHLIYASESFTLKQHFIYLNAIFDISI